MFIKLKLRTGDDVAIQIDKIVAIIERPKHTGVTIQERYVEIRFDSGYPIHVDGTFEEVFSAIQDAASPFKIFAESRANFDEVPPGANFRPHGPGQAAFEEWVKQNGNFEGPGRIPSFQEIDEAFALLREPLVLSVDERPNVRCEPFDSWIFAVNGQAKHVGTLNECIEARHAYAVGCDQNDVAYTMTDLPEVKD